MKTISQELYRHHRTLQRRATGMIPELRDLSYYYYYYIGIYIAPESN